MAPWEAGVYVTENTILEAFMISLFISRNVPLLPFSFYSSYLLIALTALTTFLFSPLPQAKADTPRVDIQVLRTNTEHYGVAIDNNRLYSPNGNDLDVFDLSQSESLDLESTLHVIEPIKTIRLGLANTGINLNYGRSNLNPILSVAGMIYLCNPSDNSVSIIDSSTNEVKATIAVGADPVKSVLYQNQLFVLNFADKSVSVIDINSLKLLRTIPFDAQKDANGNLVSNPLESSIIITDLVVSQGRLYLTAKDTYGLDFYKIKGYLLILNIQDFSLVQKVSLGMGLEPLIAVGGDRVYIAETLIGKLFSFDRGTGQMTEVATPKRWSGGIASGVTGVRLGFDTYDANHPSDNPVECNYAILDPATNQLGQPITYWPNDYGCQSMLASSAGVTAMLTRGTGSQKSDTFTISDPQKFAPQSIDMKVITPVAFYTPGSEDGGFGTTNVAFGNLYFIGGSGNFSRKIIKAFNPNTRKFGLDIHLNYVADQLIMFQNSAFALESNSRRIEKVNLLTRKVVTIYSIPRGVFSIQTDGHNFYASYGGNYDHFFIISLMTNKILAKYSPLKPGGFFIFKDNFAFIAVNGDKTGRFNVLNLTNFSSQIKTITLPSYFNGQVRNESVYSIKQSDVYPGYSREIEVTSWTSGAHIAAIPLLEGYSSIIFDSGKYLYVSGRTASFHFNQSYFLQKIDIDTNQVVQTRFLDQRYNVFAATDSNLFATLSNSSDLSWKTFSL
jgi:YVTN family beta-propeller protein